MRFDDCVGTNLRQTLTLRALIVKVFGVICSVSGGLCIGKEGPLVHAGSVFGANISHGFDLCIAKAKLPLWKKYRNDVSKRDFVSGGCAAGVAAAFGAPMGGVLFAFEEASSFWSLPLTWKCFFCAMTSCLALNFWRAVYNGNPELINSNSMIAFGVMESDQYQLWELPVFMLMAVVGGLLGALFNILNFKLSLWRRDRGWPKYARHGETVLVAFVSGTAFFLLPLIYYACLDVFTSGQNSRLSNFSYADGNAVYDGCRLMPKDIICQHSCTPSGDTCGVWDGRSCRSPVASDGKIGSIPLLNVTLSSPKRVPEKDWEVASSDLMENLCSKCKSADQCDYGPKLTQCLNNLLNERVPGVSFYDPDHSTSNAWLLLATLKKYYNVYDCTDILSYNGLASLSFTKQENTIHGLFHTYTNPTVVQGENGATEASVVFLYSTGECIIYFIVYFSLAIWTYGIRA
eukprot:SAG31_NODE_1017_length_10360_cov_35.198811_10_plen_460_part_00